ncbi:MAG: methyltransferase domain-containing protein [Pseudomonadota bacterium]|nr:methyltransferase domain-containing protein [Pseudomonadota bacterium]
MYRDYRPGVVAAMALEPGGRALDLACGTGPNLPLLAAAVGPAGHVLGVDFSGGMLTRARRRVAELPQVALLQHDARTLTSAEVGPIDAIISTLGLSVIPDPEAVLAAMWALLAPGGRFVIFDVYAERWVPASSWIKLIAQADLYRRPWEVLEGLGATVEREWLAGSPHIHGGRPYLLVARKP